ncbi:2-amino-4-hydroxy-6-hydroxymethyldihydropteridine diphosphokinase [Aureimonas psammosilenae]|uniref:2-amino-4-hydroxy-6- hydroxymethyldihydropteridine diphosphokinase n=1 Tax=Aureimonas psammosilenae TaxID=2495496 RepID=UPI0012609F14|nr:2-amino-4-hydroxy-6-hydroxymethyldihydropteridine diphosphokinase [Aureimonas psammosilenae]
MSTAYLGLGGNIGDPVANMRAALQDLGQRRGIELRAVSRLYRTPPWGKTDQPFFFNAVARIETVLEARELLATCLDIERGLKRERIERWGPRTIDIDILAVEGVEMSAEDLTIPHPRMTERAFVLVPLSDVAADLAIDGRPIAAYLAGLDLGGIEPVGDAKAWWR